jgi:hypothetical protein
MKKLYFCFYFSSISYQHNGKQYLALIHLLSSETSITITINGSSVNEAAWGVKETLYMLRSFDMTQILLIAYQWCLDCFKWNESFYL